MQPPYAGLHICAYVAYICRHTYLCHHTHMPRYTCRACTYWGHICTSGTHICSSGTHICTSTTILRRKSINKSPIQGKINWRRPFLLDSNNFSIGIHFFKVLVQIHYSRSPCPYIWVCLTYLGSFATKLRDFTPQIHKITQFQEEITLICQVRTLMTATLRRHIKNRLVVGHNQQPP